MHSPPNGGLVFGIRRLGTPLPRPRPFASICTGAAFGAAGQRCMALSAAVFVGEAKEWLPDLVEKAKTLKLGEGTTPGVDMGPLITVEAKKRAEALIGSAEQDGCGLPLDGRGYTVPGFESGCASLLLSAMSSAQLL